MEQKVAGILEHLVESYPVLEGCRRDIEDAFRILSRTFADGGKLLVCGNGGSAADSEHIVGELMKGFVLKRSLCASHRDKLYSALGDEGLSIADHLQGALPAISLVGHPSLAYAFINDVSPDMVFAQQVYGYGRSGDALIGLSTSGNSVNIVNAIKVAGAFGLKTIGMTGAKGGLMKGLCDVTIGVPAEETYEVQELHLPVYHALCAMVEMEFFGG